MMLGPRDIHLWHSTSTHNMHNCQTDCQIQPCRHIWDAGAWRIWQMKGVWGLPLHTSWLWNVFLWADVCGTWRDYVVDECWIEWFFSKFEIMYYGPFQQNCWLNFYLGVLTILFLFKPNSVAIKLLIFVYLYLIVLLLWMSGLCILKEQHSFGL